MRALLVFLWTVLSLVVIACLVCTILAIFTIDKTQSNQFGNLAMLLFAVSLFGGLGLGLFTGFAYDTGLVGTKKRY